MAKKPRLLHIWAVLEANGIPVAQFDDVLYRG